MASLKAEKPVGSSLFGQAKKDAPKSDGASIKAPSGSSKSSAAKKAAPKSEPKKKAKAGKSASKQKPAV